MGEIEEENEIDSALVFQGLERYAEYEPRERFAEGSHKRGNCRLEYLYDLNYEGDSPTLFIEHRFFVNGEEKHRSLGKHNRYEIEEEDGEYIVKCNGEGLKEFIKADFYADPEIALAEAYDDFKEGVA